MQPFCAAVKLQTLRQQASTHNALCEINHAKQLERLRAWRELRLAITSLIHLEVLGHRAAHRHTNA